MTIDGNVSAWLEVTNGVAGSIDGGPVTSTGYVVLGQDGETFTGSAEFDAVQSSGYVTTLSLRRITITLDIGSRKGAGATALCI